jgi:hypothetical protein
LHRRVKALFVSKFLVASFEISNSVGLSFTLP